MGEHDQTDALLAVTQEALQRIESLYKRSLAKRDLDSRLLIEIKNLLENLRSALDYVAREVYERFCTPFAGKAIDVYFPILRRTATPEDFENFANGRFPGLDRHAPLLYECLESFQFFRSAENQWLVQFNELCQENKHERLTPQTRTEERHTEFSGKSGGSVGWNEAVEFGPKGRITFKPGGRLVLSRGGSVGLSKDGAHVMGRPVDPKTQVPARDDRSELRQAVWVDYRFEAMDISALRFLRECVAGVSNIIRTVREAENDIA